MGDTNSEAAATMEKLELLSATALLKQGIDGTTTSSNPLEEDHNYGNFKNRILETPSFGQTTIPNLASSGNSPSSLASAITKPIFSVASTTSVTGLLMQGVSSPAADLAANNNNNAVSSHLASPVSADGDDVLPNSSSSIKTASFAPKGGSGATLTTSTLNTSVSTQSLQQIIESRSPLASVEYHRQQVVDVPTPSPASYGYPLHPNYHAPPAAFRPPMENSAFTAFGGATLGGPACGSFAAAPSADNGYHSHSQHQQERQLPSPRHLTIPTKVTVGAEQQAQGSSYEGMAREIAFMREQLKEKDMVVSSLQHRVNFLENKIIELRQLPTGKISHIPVE